MRKCQDGHRLHRYRKFLKPGRLGLVLLCPCGSYIPIAESRNREVRCWNIGCSNTFALTDFQLAHRVKMVCPACTKSRGKLKKGERVEVQDPEMLRAMKELGLSQGPWSGEENAEE